MKKENDRYLRTYKNGIRLPASLLDPFSRFVRTSEVVQFLRKDLGATFTEKQWRRLGRVEGAWATPVEKRWELFKTYKNLGTSSKLREYEVLFEKYRMFSAPELDGVHSVNLQEIAKYTRSELHHDDALNLKDRINDPANPDVSEISLHDYQQIARSFFKRLCANSRTFAMDHINSLPADENLTERKVTRILGAGANHLHSVSTQMATMMNVYKDTREKLVETKRFLTSSESTDFLDVLPIYQSYYSVPFHFRNYMAGAWEVDPHWVRNTLVGWRRKLDPFLPQKLRIEPLTALMEDLANYSKQSCTLEEEVKIIGILQRKHVLHLLPFELGLEALLSPKLRPYLAKLRGKIQFTDEILHEIQDHVTRFNVPVFQGACVKLIDEVSEKIKDLDLHSPSYKRTRAFLNKLKLLTQALPEFKEVLENFLPGNRYTSSVSKIIIKMLNKEGKNKNRSKRLFTALRGVTALAFAHRYPEATAHFEESFTPDNCVTRPFTSNRKRKKYLPLELKSPKYVILRKRNPIDKKTINNEEVTDLFKKGEPLWLGFQIYTPDQFLEDGTLNGQHKGVLWFRLHPTRKIRTCLQRGAVVKSIRLNVPRGPTSKIVADITLGSDSRTPFEHSPRFLKAWQRNFQTTKIPASPYLGKDLNRLGKYMIALANTAEEIDISEIMEEFERAFKKVELFRKKIIPVLQRNLTTRQDGKDGRRRAEITCLHNKRKRTMTHYNLKVLLVYLYAIWRSQARHVSWDGIEGVSPRGKKGDFAISVQYLPNNREQFRTFKDWLKDLKTQNQIPPEVEVHLTSPYTSQVCPVCYSNSGTLNRNRDPTAPYHEFRCKACGYHGNRHSTAAMVEAISVKKAVEGIP